MSIKKKKAHHEEEGGEAWLLPYSDLMTLLLAVFIVLFAVSKIDVEKAKNLAAAFREVTGTGSEDIFSGEGNAVITIFPEKVGEDTSESKKEEVSETKSDTSKEKTNLSDEELKEFLGKYEYDNLGKLKSKLDTMIKKDNLASEMTTAIDTRGLVINLNNNVLFESGKAELKSENTNMLKRIAKIVKTLDNYIRIEGHTDNIPIHSEAYPSNWELSSARASSVVRLFINECDVPPDKIMAVGYGEYKPIADNSTAEGRAKNRRIQIIIMSEKYDNLEK